jgi:ankyrin repeat protein
MLVKAGAEVDAPQNSSGWTDLMGAAMNGKVDTVKALLDAEANVLIKDDFGKTALNHAEEEDVNEEVITLLREAEARK